VTNWVDWHGDLGACSDFAPVEVLMLCGIFGNIDEAGSGTCTW
jgi:hypothetical protein